MTQNKKDLLPKIKKLAIIGHPTRGKDLCAKMLYPEIDIKCECNGNCCQNCKVSALLEFRGIMMEKYFVDMM